GAAGIRRLAAVGTDRASAGQRAHGEVHRAARALARGATRRDPAVREDRAVDREVQCADQHAPAAIAARAAPGAAAAAEVNRVRDVAIHRIRNARAVARVVAAEAAVAAAAAVLRAGREAHGVRDLAQARAVAAQVAESDDVDAAGRVDAQRPDLELEPPGLRLGGLAVRQDRPVHQLDVREAALADERHDGAVDAQALAVEGVVRDLARGRDHGDRRAGGDHRRGARIADDLARLARRLLAVARAVHADRE